MSYMEQFNFWVEDAYFDEATKNELLAIKDDEKEMISRKRYWFTSLKNQTAKPAEPEFEKQ